LTRNTVLCRFRQHLSGYCGILAARLVTRLSRRGIMLIFTIRSAELAIFSGRFARHLIINFHFIQRKDRSTHWFQAEHIGSSQISVISAGGAFTQPNKETII
jgi:hypothetical protein